MLGWISAQMMQLQASQKVGTPKGKHSSERTTYFSGIRVRRFDIRLGAMYLLVPKAPQGRPHSVLCDGQEAFGVNLDGGRATSLYQ